MNATHTCTASISSMSAEELLQPLVPYDQLPAPELLAYVRQAAIEIETKLRPVSPERLRQIVSRLILHFLQGECSETIDFIERYSSDLKDYPEDLLCAAYHYFLTRHYSTTPPTVYDLILFMMPEMQRRKSIQIKLRVLLQNDQEMDA